MADLQLTPIGTSPAWYNPGEPTTGFLLEHDGYRVLVDCGSGVVARYLDHFGARPIDAIFITHMHADHMFDLVPLKYGIQYGPLGSWKPQLWLPPGGVERLGTLVSAWDGPADFFTSVFDVNTHSAGTSFDLGPISCETLRVPHFIEAWAVRCSAGGGTFGYTSDLGPSPDIAPFMRNVDLLLTEATLPEQHTEHPDARGHLTASEAGTIAHEAGAHSLLLTHVPSALGEADVLADVRRTYAGPTAFARSLQPYPIAQRLAHAV